MILWSCNFRCFLIRPPALIIKPACGSSGEDLLLWVILTFPRPVMWNLVIILRGIRRGGRV